MQVVMVQHGRKQMENALKVYRGADRELRRITWRAGKSGRTRAAKLLRAKTKIKARDIKVRMSNDSSERHGARLVATRQPIPVQNLGGVGIRAKSDRAVTIARWPTSSGVSRREFREGWKSGAAFKATFRGKPDRIVAQSIARLWIDMRDEIQGVMRDYQREKFRKWIAKVRRQSGAR